MEGELSPLHRRDPVETLALHWGQMRAWIACWLLFGLLPVYAQRAVPAPSLHDLKEAEALGDHLYKNVGATGLVLVVVRGNEVYFHGYGETAVGSHQVPQNDSVVRICSLTKTFTADLLSKLAADHTVRLSDSLQRYAPTGAVVPEREKPITLLELATHTAGLSREIGSPPRGTPHFTYPGYKTRWEWLGKQSLLYTPGTMALYSNTGYDLLADALAEAAHQSYPALLASRTLTPLHMAETTLFPDAMQCARLLQGANDQGPCTSTENTMGSSGLYSTPADMAKWLAYLVGAGGPTAPVQADDAHAIYLLPASLVRETGLDHAGAPTGIGLAWMHLGANDDPEHIIEKTGGGAGFLTYIAIHPASHTALFLAATDGLPGAGTPGFNLFKAANNALLALAGLPPLQEEIHPVRPARVLRAAHRGGAHKNPVAKPNTTARHAGARKSSGPKAQSRRRPAM
jgi:D-alanyl-D-alanine-carboxypeptidase/D-alanyl-D-alanine-endopeptidase